MTGTIQIISAGDAATIVEFEDRIDPLINAQAVRLVEGLRRTAQPGIRDIVPTYRSVAIYYDPLLIDHDRLISRIRTLAADLPPESSLTTAAIRVPVWYGGEFGPDLPEVARFAHVTENEVVALHAATIYRVYMLGFVPGFAYMGSVDARIAAPRRQVPRTKVPAGSVAIAGLQTGVYPSPTPGGWQILGRTPVKPFDLARSPVCLFNPGDTVQFYAADPS